LAVPTSNRENHSLASLALGRQGYRNSKPDSIDRITRYRLLAANRYFQGTKAGNIYMFRAGIFANGDNDIKLNISNGFTVISDQAALLITTAPHFDDPRINESTVLGYLLLSILHTLDHLNKRIANKISEFHYLGFPRVMLKPNFSLLIAEG
jgi:hypothetical protein